MQGAAPRAGFHRGAAAVPRHPHLQEIDMLNRKSLIVATAAALTLGTAALTNPAQAHDNGLLGAVVGAGIGAAIGHNVHGRDGALVGGAIGAIAGASIAANSSSYYDDGYYAPPAYYGPATTYYEPATTYYEPTTTYYQPASVYYSQPRVRYVLRDGGHAHRSFAGDRHDERSVHGRGPRR
jgi:hypothetical protein